MKFTKILFLTLIAIFAFGCGGDAKKPEKQADKKPAVEEEAVELDPMQNKGVGPVSSVTLAAVVDQAMADAGKEIYEAKCTACHKVDKKFIGPAPTGIMTRRSPEWIMNMILAPEKMVKEDPIAKALLMEFNGAPMANQNLSEEEARNILEYFRTL